MTKVIEGLKARARVMHKRASCGDGQQLARLQALPELASATDETLRRGVKRRHCLAAIARELGFDGWPHAKSVLCGEGGDDLGTLMHREMGGAYWNIWSASYAEAQQIRSEHGGYLLPWKRQFLVVEDHYVEALGLDPADPDWERIGRDWVRPSDRHAWERLVAKAIDAKLSALS